MKLNIYFPTDCDVRHDVIYDIAGWMEKHFTTTELEALQLFAVAKCNER